MLSCFNNYDRLENAPSGLNPYLIQWQTKLAPSRQQWPILLSWWEPLSTCQQYSLIKKWIGIHCTNSLHLTNPLLGTAGEVFWEKKIATLCSENKISKCSGFYSRMSTAFCPFSFQRNDIVVRQENECVCRVRVGICVHIFTCVIRYFHVNISLFPFLLCILLLWKII